MVCTDSYWHMYYLCCVCVPQPCVGLHLQAEHFYTLAIQALQSANVTGVDLAVCHSNRAGM